MSDQSATRFLVFAAGLLGAAAVLIGAFAAHGMEGWLADRGLEPELVARRIAQFEVGVRYHFFHTLALLGLVAAEPLVGSKWVRRIGWLMILGIVVFSGSLYLLVALNLSWLGAITPIGGVTWVVAWILLAWRARSG